MIVSVDAKKRLTKFNSHSWFFKKYTVFQLGIERNFLNVGHFGKIIASIILMMKYWSLSFQGREQEGIFSPLLFNIVHGSYGHWNNGRKRSK